MISIKIICILFMLTQSVVRVRSCFFFFLIVPRPPGSTQVRSSAASDLYKSQLQYHEIKLAIIFKKHTNGCNPNRNQLVIARTRSGEYTKKNVLFK